MLKDAMEKRSCTRMGQLLDEVQGSFINSCLQQEQHITSILDVGGGAGRFAIPLQNKGYQVTVTEVRPQPLWYLKTKNRQINTLLTDRKSRVWPLKAGSTDCVLAIEIPTIVYHPWFWQECYRVLKTNGIVIVCLSNRNSYKGLFCKLRSLLVNSLRAAQGQKLPEERWYSTSVHTVVSMFEKTGFELAQAHGYNWLPVSKTSNSRFVPLYEQLERKLCLGHFVYQSPWVALEIRAC